MFNKATLICDEDRSELLFKSCSKGAIYYAINCVTIMQTSAVARSVFIKATKKAMNKNPTKLRRKRHRT